MDLGIVQEEGETTKNTNYTKEEEQGDGRSIIRQNLRRIFHFRVLCVIRGCASAI
jgi:hypothetical protein